MGQRLNIEIKKKGEEKVLANCYYHWSAYTSSSLELGISILDNLINFKGSKDNDKMKAIKILQTTGAGVIEEEYNTLTQEEQKYCKIAENRNLGLISITDKGMKETRQWQEGIMTIELNDNDYKDLKHFKLYSTIDFGVYWENDLDYVKEEYQEQIKSGELDLENIVEFDFDLTEMTISDLYLFQNKLSEIENNFGAFKIKNDENNIYFIVY